MYTINVMYSLVQKCLDHEKSFVIWALSAPTEDFNSKHKDFRLKFALTNLCL